MIQHKITVAGNGLLQLDVMLNHILEYLIHQGRVKDLILIANILKNGFLN